MSGGQKVSQRIALLGAGQMGEALLGGWLASGLVEPAGVWATDVSAARRDLAKRRFGVRVGASNAEAAAWAELIVLAVKPQVLGQVLEEIAPVAGPRLVLSIAAGVPIGRIASRIQNGGRVVRVMPNAPALVRAGVSALAFGPGVTEVEAETARRLFEAVGAVVVVEERLMDAVTGLSGSGPAYVCLVVEALADGGVKMGLPRTVAERLAAQTVLGAARMLVESGEHPAKLKDRVASPGGTTIAGLAELEQAGVRASLIAAVEAATRRSEALGG
ncbi:pyrroline-5-carboxylate reductase [Nitrospira sp. Kam-Ns4a]